MRPGRLDDSQIRPWLYLVAESDTGWVRYVGRTKAPAERIRAHRTSWVFKQLTAELKRRGARLEMILLREIEAGEDPDAAEQAEMNARMHLDGLLNQKSASGAHAGRNRFRRHLSTVAADDPDRNG